MSIRLLNATGLLALALLAAGCGDPSRADPASAEETLRLALDAWKDDRRPDSLSAGDPAIQASDPRWQSGFRLLGYEVGGPPSPSGHDLRCSVVLRLQDPRGKKVRERADYTVTTRPVRTVVRAAF